MRYSNMSVGQIASYLGFSDAAYFSRFFSREAGSSPRAFRRATRDRALAVGSLQIRERRCPIGGEQSSNSLRND